MGGRETARRSEPADASSSASEASIITGATRWETGSSSGSIRTSLVRGLARSSCPWSSMVRFLRFLSCSSSHGSAARPPREALFPSFDSDARLASMERAPVEVRVAGQTYRVVGSTNAEDMQRLAHVVEGKLRELPGAGALHPPSMLLVAMSLA